MKPVKDRQFLNITYLSSLFGATAATAMFETVIAPLTSMYASLKLHKLDFNIEVLNLFWLLLLYVLCVPSIIFTHFFILNWIVNLVHCLTIFFFFYCIPLLYYYINLNSSLISRLSLEGIYIFRTLTRAEYFLFVYHTTSILSKLSSLRTLVTPVVLHSLTWATLMSPEKENCRLSYDCRLSSVLFSKYCVVIFCDIISNFNIYLYFWEKAKIRKLLQNLDLLIELNSE